MASILSQKQSGSRPIEGGVSGHAKRPGFDPNEAGDIIFGIVTGPTGIAPCPDCDPLLGFTALFQGLETYNLETSFGPVSSPFDFETSVFNQFRNISTSESILSLVASNDTFTAVAASPEPASLWLLGLGVAGLLVSYKLKGIVNFVGLRRSARL